MRKYDEPDFEVITFEVEDVITTSGLDPDLGENDLPVS